jgi:hypothetical protein
MSELVAPYEFVILEFFLVRPGFKESQVLIAQPIKF